MAIFESAPRSATAVAEEEAELLALSPEKFKQTIYQKPEMAFEIFRELSASPSARGACCQCPLTRWWFGHGCLDTEGHPCYSRLSGVGEGR